ncbi:MAG: HAMP domain-containing protein [Armatimonadetes bacterium]|nr:HAMP domain-containing protein [Armatimonadota bacterium]
MARSSLAGKFAGIVATIGTIILISVCTISYQQSAKMVTQQIQKQAEVQTRSNTQVVDALFANSQSLANSIAARQKTRGEKHLPDDTGYFGDLLMASSKDVFGVYFVPEHVFWKDPLCGTYVTRGSYPNAAPATYNHQDPEQDWYWAPKTTLKPHVTGAYYDSDAQITMVSYTTPVKNPEGKLMGVAGVDLSLNTVQDVTTKLKIPLQNVDLSKQTAMLVDAQKKLIVHPNKGFLVTEKNEAASFSTLPLAKYVDFSKDQGVAWSPNSMVVWAKSGVSQWTTVIEIPRSQITAQLVGLRDLCVGISVAGVAVLCFVTWLVSRRIVKPLVRFTQAAGQLAKGDCTIQFEATTKDEVGALAKALNQAAEHHRTIAQAATSLAEGDLTVRVESCDASDLVGLAISDIVESWSKDMQSIQSSSGCLSSSGDNLTGVAHSCDSVIRRVDQDVELASEGMKYLLAGSAEIVNANRNLESRVDELRATFEAIRSAMASATEQTSQGTNAQLEFLSNAVEKIRGAAEDISGLRDRMAATVEQAYHAYAEVEKLSDSESSIRTITEELARISGKVRMLALNATIEAARAGEAGRGFAVVATEINILASQSSESTKRVDEILEAVRSHIESVTEHVTKTRDAISEGERASEQSVLWINESCQALTQVRSAATDNQSAVQALQSLVARGEDAVEEVSSSCQETLHSTQVIEAQVNEVSVKLASIQQECSQLSGSSDTLLAVAQSVSEAIHSLQAVTTKFKITDDRPDLKIVA